jgi:glutaminyl-tRNA synthetase
MLMRDPLIPCFTIVIIIERDWKIYPMYDFAHGESDYTRKFRILFVMLEFVMTPGVIQLVLDQIYDENKVRPHQYEFAFEPECEQAKIIATGAGKHCQWMDDPRMPTISGIRRRGYTVASIRKFCISLVGKRENVIDVSLLEFCLREDLTKPPQIWQAPDPVKLV